MWIGKQLQVVETDGVGVVMKSVSGTACRYGLYIGNLSKQKIVLDFGELLLRNIIDIDFQLIADNPAAHFVSVLCRNISGEDNHRRS